MRELKEMVFPETFEELWEKQEEYGSKALVIAGGTEIVADPPAGIECLIDIRKLGLNSVTEQDTYISIGATTTMESMARSPVVASLGRGMLCRSGCEGWPVPVRHAATLGGNLAGGDPFADTPAALLALGAEVVLETAAGTEIVSIQDFFVDYRKTAAVNAILVEVRIPKTPPGGKGAFLKCAPSSIDKALVNIGVYGVFAEGKCQNFRLAVGALTRTPRRMPEVEEFLNNQSLRSESIAEAAELLARQVDPILDMRASAEKRRLLLKSLFKRAVHQLAQAG